MLYRKAFVLTCDPNSERTQFSKNILEKIGFDVELFNAIPNEDKVLSNKLSMLMIYKIIYESECDWVYVFEDDINILEDIDLNEIVKYEEISSKFFYLGLCDFDDSNFKNNVFNKTKISNNLVKIISGNVRGLHAIGISKDGALELAEHASSSSNIYMDCCLEEFSIKYPANVVRYDLESYINGHRGIFFQDRDRFPTTVFW